MSDPFQSDKSKLYEQFDRTSNKVRRDVLEVVLAQMTPEQVAVASTEMDVRHEAQKAEWAERRRQMEIQEAKDNKEAFIVAMCGIGFITIMISALGIAEYFSNKKQLPQVKPA